MTWGFGKSIEDSAKTLVNVVNTINTIENENSKAYVKQTMKRLFWGSIGLTTLLATTYVYSPNNSESNTRYFVRSTPVKMESETDYNNPLVWGAVAGGVFAAYSLLRKKD